MMYSVIDKMQGNSLNISNLVRNELKSLRSISGVLVNCVLHRSVNQTGYKIRFKEANCECRVSYALRSTWRHHTAIESERVTERGDQRDGVSETAIITRRLNAATARRRKRWSHRRKRKCMYYRNKWSFMPNENEPRNNGQKQSQ